MRRVLPCLAIALVAMLVFARTPHAEASPQFVMGFKLLADRIPTIVGQPLEDEHYNPINGDGLQQTSNGLMVWRKAENWTAFTNGSHTWINGPYGIQDRPNDQRFSWESSVQSVGLMQHPLQGAGFDAGAEQAALDMVNQSRQQNGVPPLMMDEALHQLARARAQDMSARNYFSHITPEGKSPFDLMTAGGISYRMAAENIGYGVGFGSPTDSVRNNHNTMMAETPPDDGHKENILNGSLHKVGIGVYTGQNGKTYYVCDFTD